MWLQLNRSRSIRNTVATITAALLSSGVAGAADPGQNRAETSFLLYSEKNRVTAEEAVIGVNKLLKGNQTLQLKLTYDGMTGATPTGAAPSRKAQTFTRPSGRGSYVIQPGEIPLDNTFKDNRFAADASISQPWGRMTVVNFGAHGSAEHDYSSIGLNGGITRDFNRKNTTFGISGAYSHDVTTAVGGTPVPFTPEKAVSAGGEGENIRIPRTGKPKEIYDVVVGFSQILSRMTIFRMNYSFDRASGYLIDPYKVLSVVQPADSVDPGETVVNIYENRPASRNKNAVYGELRQYLSGNTIDLSYRYFWDNWGVISHTVDISYLWQFQSGKSIQPHFRWYRQLQANFYRPFLVQGAALPAYASADARLAKFDAYTMGLQYSVPISDISRLNISAEYYFQRGDGSPPEAFGALSGLNLFPKMNALMIRLGYSYDF